MSERFRELTAQQPAAQAIIEPGRVFRRAELDHRVDQLAHLLGDRGVGAGDRIAWMMGNRAEVLMLGLAAQRLGAVVVPIGYRSAPAELTRMLAVAKPKVLLVDSSPTGPFGGLPGGSILNVDSPAFADELAASPPTPITTPSDAPERLGAGASLIFTSGTTGNPKAALRTRGDSRLAAVIAGALGFTADVRFLPAGPLYHSGPGTCALWALSHGGVVGLLPRFDPMGWLGFADQHCCTASFITPTQLRRLVDEVEAGAPAPRSLTGVIVSGEPFPPELKRRAVAALGPCLIDCYGCTELGPLTHQPAADLLARPHSCGRPFPGIELAAFEGEQPLPPGEIGVLRVRTPLAFVGYVTDAATGPAGDDGSGRGWAAVGDVGYVDEDGYVHLVDRADDMVITGGVNVFPADVEAVLAEHPAVRHCAVVGLPDAQWGQVLCAAVVSAAEISVAEVRAWLHGRIADDKRPRRLIRLTSLPTTATGKVSRRELRRMLTSERSELGWP